jgi:hypothetical protein
MQNWKICGVTFIVSDHSFALPVLLLVRMHLLPHHANVNFLLVWQRNHRQGTIKSDVSAHLRKPFQSEKIPGSAFESQWVGQSLQAQKSLLIFLQTTQRPIRPSSFKLIYLSLETFIRVFTSDVFG